MDAETFALKMDEFKKQFYDRRMMTLDKNQEESDISEVEAE